MKPIYDVLSRFWVLVPNKLGRCPYCMRASARATIAGWAMAALLSVLLPGSLAVGLVVVVATGFTALFVAHMLAYTWRVIPFVLHHQECFFSRPTNRDRRQLLSSSLRLGMGAVTIALLGFGRTALGGSDEKACPGRHRLKDKQISGTADDESDAKRKLLLAAIAECDTFCAGRECNKGTCIQFKRAGQAGKPKLKNVNCTRSLTSVTCTADIESCHCECDKDDGSSTISATTEFSVSQSVSVSSSTSGSLFGTVVADVTLDFDQNTLELIFDFTGVQMQLSGEIMGTFRGSSIVQYPPSSLPSLPTSFIRSPMVQFDNGISIGADSDVEGIIQPDATITEGTVTFFNFGPI